MLPYLQLMRLPAVFSSLADVLLGGVLVSGGAPEMSLRWGWLLLASAGLYLAGMVWNDYFDRAVDAVERPGRPIPSGRVSAPFAARLGLVLAGVGTAAAWLAGPSSGAIAALLLLCILAYDALLKQTPLGPLAMGACRTLNVLLGASLVGEWHLVWEAPHVCYAGGLGLYIAGVTWFARDEAGTSRRGGLLWGAAVVVAGLAALMLAVWRFPNPAAGDFPLGLIALAGISLTIVRRLLLAVPDAGPAAIQGAVTTLLMSYVSLDAALVLHATNSPAWTLAVLALLVPANLLRRWMSVT